MQQPVMPAGQPLSEEAVSLLHLLLDTPLASIENSKAIWGLEDSYVRDAVKELEESGLLKSDALGCIRERTRRRRLSEEGLNEAGVLGPSWHDDGNAAILLQRMPPVEAFYEVPGMIQDMGKVTGFEWFSGISLDAKIDYEEGWVGLVWCGMMQRESHISDKLTDFGSDLLELACGDQISFPAMVIFIVEDCWQGELVLRATRHLPLASMLVSIWCIAEGPCPPMIPSLRSIGRIHQPAPNRGVGRWSWEQRVNESPWSQTGNLAFQKLLTTNYQFPGMRSDLAKQVLHEGKSGRSATRTLTEMTRQQVVERLMDRGRFRYEPSSRGLNLMAQRDRISLSTPGKATSTNEKRRKRLQVHEDGVMYIAGKWMADGAPVAVGFRSWEDMGKRGGAISPDAMVYLVETPFGPTWCYLEYELSARGKRRVGKKLNKFKAKYRQDEWPVLIVCFNEAAESVFQELGRETDLRMLTTTVRRLKEAGHEECWSHYGQKATLRARVNSET